MGIESSRRGREGVVGGTLHYCKAEAGRIASVRAWGTAGENDPGSHGSMSPRAWLTPTARQQTNPATGRSSPAQLGSFSMLLAYDDDGPGPVLVLLHGFPLNRKIWSLQEGRVGAMYRIIAPDLRGHGETAAPPGVYTMEAMAGDVVELLD